MMGYKLTIDQINTLYGHLQNGPQDELYVIIDSIYKFMNLAGQKATYVYGREPL